MAQARRSGTTLAAGTWALDAAESRFAFQVKHFWGLMTVRGSFQRAEGRAAVDASGSISATLQIAAESVESKQQQRDKHLRSADFFHVEQHPTITFSTTQVDVLEADRLQIVGDLTVAGHTERITFEARLAQSGNTVTVDAEVPVDRMRFGITWNPLHMASSAAVLEAHAQFSQEER